MGILLGAKKGGRIAGMRGGKGRIVPRARPARVLPGGVTERAYWRHVVLSKEPSGSRKCFSITDAQPSTMSPVEANIPASTRRSVDLRAEVAFNTARANGSASRESAVIGPECLIDLSRAIHRYSLFQALVSAALGLSS